MRFIWLMTMQKMLKMKKRSHRYNINRPRPTNGHKYTKCKMCLCVMMVICIKEQLNNIWSSIHEKVKQHWGWVEKKELLIKKKACRENSEVSVHKCPAKKLPLKNSKNLQASCNFLRKDTLAQVFLCEFCKILKAIFTSGRLLPNINSKLWRF